MEIKKLTKQETEEGITLELVNSRGVAEKSSPVLFEKDGEVYNLLECSTGYWAQDKNGTYVKENGKLKVFPPRDCRIARARYLLYFSEQEKEAETQKLYEKRKQKAVAALANYRKNIDAVKRRAERQLDWMSGALLQLAGQDAWGRAAKEQFDAETEEQKRLLPLLEAEYAECEKQLSEGNITYLLVFFGIEKQTEFGEPLVTAHFDNPDEMRIVTGVFGKDAFDKYGGDMEKHIARLRVEQKY